MKGATNVYFSNVYASDHAAVAVFADCRIRQSKNLMFAASCDIVLSNIRASSTKNEIRNTDTNSELKKGIRKMTDTNKNDDTIEVRAQELVQTKSRAELIDMFINKYGNYSMLDADKFVQSLETASYNDLARGIAAAERFTPPGERFSTRDVYKDVRSIFEKHDAALKTELEAYKPAAMDFYAKRNATPYDVALAIQAAIEARGQRK